MAELAYTEPEPKLIAGADGDWEMVIGLEVHAQISSHAKLFSGASTAFGAAPNSNVSLVDAAMPGMLPVINGFCVEQAVRTGLGLKAKINLVSRFDRKNYFYPDLPQGYQISQLYQPIVGEGEVLVDLEPGVARKVRIERIHMEQDAGKSVHDLDPSLEPGRSQPHRRRADGDRVAPGPARAGGGGGVRAQAPPDPALPRHLRRQHAGRLAPGGRERQRAAAGIGPTLGTRCEIKNMNSMRFIQAAIEFEARRQIAIIEDGGMVEQETRLYDPGRGETRLDALQGGGARLPLLPRPRPLPLELEQAWVDAIAAGLPELPDAKKARFVADYGMTEYDAGVLSAETGERGLLRGGGAGARRQAGGELGDQRAVRPAEQAGARARREPGRGRTSSAG